MLLVDFNIWICERGYIRIAPTNEYDIKEFTGYARWRKMGGSRLIYTRNTEMWMT